MSAGEIVMLVPAPARWQRVAVAALLTVPLILVLTLSAPGGVVLPFLSKPRRDAVMQFLDRIVEWIKTIAGVY